MSIGTSQHTQLGFRVAQAIEDHHGQQRFDIRDVSGLIEDATKFAKAQGLPQLLQRTYIAQRTGRFEFNCRFGGVPQVRATAPGLEQTGADANCRTRGYAPTSNSLGTPICHALNDQEWQQALLSTISTRTAPPDTGKNNQLSSTGLLVAFSTALR